MAGRFLVTGGAGFIGSHLTEALAQAGHSVIVLDDFSGGSCRNLATALSTNRVEVVEGSVLNATIVDECVSAADVCIHLAAALGVARIVKEPLSTLRANVLGTDVVMAAAVRHGRRLLYSSSSEVYGKLNRAGLREGDDRVIGSPQKSRWSYAIAKEFGESLAHAYVQDQGAEIVVVRLFNTVGPRQASSYGMVLPRFVRQALDGDPLTVYGDGTQTRCFTDVHDVVRALSQLAVSDGAVGNVYNIGSESPTAVVDLAKLVIAHTGEKSEIVFVPYDRAHTDGFEELGNRAPDTSALRRLTGWTRRVSLEQTIVSVVSHERERRRAVARTNRTPAIRLEPLVRGARAAA